MIIWGKEVENAERKVGGVEWVEWVELIDMLETVAEAMRVGLEGVRLAWQVDNFKGSGV